MCNFRLILLAALSLIAAACTSNPQREDAVQMIQRTTGEVTDAAQQPLEDFNIVQDEIPILLYHLRDNPYAARAPANCRNLIAEIRQLDRVLGADLDTAEARDRTAADSTFSLARSLALGFVPFRSVAREVTGAEAHRRELNAAILAGTVRRAYLKGIGQRLGCSYPGSPRRLASAAGG